MVDEGVMPVALDAEIMVGLLMSCSCLVMLSFCSSMLALLGCKSLFVVMHVLVANTGFGWEDPYIFHQIGIRSE